MKATIKPLCLWPPLPLLQGERTEVRGSEKLRVLKPQTLTRPSPLEKGEANQSANANKEALEPGH